MKRLFVFVLAFAVAAAAQDFVCPPEGFFRADCNTCFCTDDNQVTACTNKMCAEPAMPIALLGDKGKSSKPVICEPETIKLDYCNFCICAKDGSSYHCTENTCNENIINKDGTLKLIEKRRLARQSRKQMCQPGSTFQDDCNGCKCSNDGATAFCTEMLCPETKNSGKNQRDKREVTERTCTPNQYFKDYCNTCLCGEDGLPMTCTDMTCDKSIFNQNGSLRGESQVLDSASSTTVANRVCEPGALSSLDGICNICICNKEGTQTACTKNHCSSSLIKIFEEEEKWGPLYKQGDACIPGKGFYSECNQCVCKADGRSAFCTFIACVT